MKKLILAVSLIMVSFAVSAQVGIGTDMPNTSSQLDVTVQAGDKGVLLARVALTSTTDTSTITNGNVESLLVYNTATAADITPGYYYWYNNKWNRVITPDDIPAPANTTNVSLTTDGIDLILTDSDGNFVSVPLASLFSETITTLVDNGDGTITYTNEAGTTQIIDVATIVHNNESITTLTDNGDGTFTYTSEDGTITNVDIPAEVLTEITDNTSNIYQEIINLIESEETLTTIVFDPTTGIFTYTDEDGIATPLDLGAMVPNFETTTSIVDNGDGTFTFTDEDGVTTVLDVSNLETITTLTDNLDGTYTYTSEDGTVTTVDVPADVLTEIQDNTSNIYQEIINLIETEETLTTTVFDPTTGIFTYTDEDGVATTLDLGAMVPNFETTTSFTDNGDGTYTFTNEDGTTTTINGALETITSLTDNGDGTYSYISEDGTMTTIDVPADMLTELSDNTSAAYQEIVNIIQANETLTTATFDPFTGMFTYTDENGTGNTLDLGAMVPNFETTTSMVDNGDGTFTFTDEDGGTTILDVSNLETITSLTDNGDGTYTYTSEDGTTTTIDIPADVFSELADNTSAVYQEVVDIIKLNETLTTLVENADGTFTYTDENGNPTILDVSNMETLTTVVLDPTTGMLTYTDEDGVATDVDLATVIDNFETVTTMVDNGDGTFTYTDEDGNPTVLDVSNLETLTSIALNPDNIHIDYTDEDGVVTQLDLTNLVDNLETVTTMVENADGTFTYTDENGNPTILDVSNMETLTTVVLDPTTGMLTYTDEDGVATDVDLATVIDNFETITTMVDNGDGTFTYTDEDGNPTVLDVSNLETLTSIALNPDNIHIDYTDEDGIVTQLDLTAIVDNLETVTTMVENADGTFTYTDENGNPTILDVSNMETLTTIALNPDNVHIDYTDEDGIVTQLDLTSLVDNLETVTTLVENADGTFTYTDEDGNPTILDVSNMETLTTAVLEPTTGMLTYTDEDGVATPIDLATVIDNFETVTTMVDNGDGTFTYTDEDGNPTILDVANLETLTTIALNPDNVHIDYTDEDGNVTQLDLSNLVDNLETVTTLVENADGTFTYTDEDGNPTILDVSNMETLTTAVLDPTTGMLTYTDEDGVATPIDLAQMIDNFETVTTMVDNGDGTFTYTDEDGNPTILDVANLETLTTIALNPDNVHIDYTDEDGNVTQLDLTNLVDNLETVTTLVENADGTFTYTDEDGNPTILDVSNMETLTTAVLDPTTGMLTYTDEDGVATPIDLAQVIDNFETVTTMVDNGDGTFTYTDEDGNPTILDVANLETLTTIALNPDNVHIDYTDEDGVVTQLDLTNLVDNLETVTTLVENADGTFTYTDEDGNPTILDVSNMETLTTAVLDPTTGMLTYTDEDGVATPIDLATVIDNFETVTTMVDNGDGTFTYTDEDGNPTILDVSNMETLTSIALNGDNVHIDYTDEDGVTTQLDLTGIVDNLETVTSMVYDSTTGILAYTDENGNTGAINLSTIVAGFETLTFISQDNVAGTITYIDEEGNPTVLNIATLIEQHETVTSLMYNPATGIAAYTDENGNTSTINLSTIVTGFETLTFISQDTAGGTITYTDEEGNPTVLDIAAIIEEHEAVTTLVDNGDGTYTYTDEDGNPSTINTNASTNPYDNTTSGMVADNVQDAIDELELSLEQGGGVSLIDNADGTITLQASNGADLGTLSKANLTDNTDGSYTFTNNDGTDVTFDVKTVDVQFNAATNSYEFLDSAGNVITTIDLNADNIAYDNTTSGMTADNVQDAIDELETSLEQGGGVSLIDNADGTITLQASNGADLGTLSKANLTDNTDGSYTFTNNDGTDVTFDVKTVDVQFNAATNSYEFLDSAGNVITTIDLNADNIAYDNTTSGMVADNVQDAIDELELSLEQGGGVSLIDNADGTITLQASNGADLGTLSKANLTDNTDGSYTFTNNDGTDVTFDVKTVDVQFDPVTNNYEFLDSAGNAIATIDLNATNIAYDNTTSGMTADNVQDAINELESSLEQGGGVSLIDNANGTITLQASNGADLGTLSKANLTDNTDGSYTFTNNDGTDVTFDVLSVDVQFDPATNSYEFLDSAGNVISTIDLNATNIAYDNTASGMTADNVQDAIDELETSLEQGGGVSLIDNVDGTITLQASNGADLGTLSKANLTDNTDGSYTFTNNDGTDVTFDVKTVDVQFDPATNSYEFLDSAGNVIATIDLNATNIAYDNTTSGMTAGDVQSAIDELDETIEDNNTALGTIDLVDNADGAVTLIKPDGTSALVSKSDVTDNGDGTYTFTNNDGTDVTIDANQITITDNADGSYDVTDGTGTTIATIDTAADSNPYDNTTSGMTATNVQDAIDELENTIQTNKGDLSVAGGIEFTTGNDGTDKLLANTEIQVADGGITNAKLATDAVTTDKILDGTVGTTDLATDAVTTDKILNGEVKAADLGADPVDVGKVGVVQADGSVVYQNISSSNVDGADLTNSDGSILVTDGTGATLVNAQVQVADGGITNAKLATDAVTSDKILDGTVATADLTNDAITADKINSDVAGSGLTQNATTGALEVDVTALTGDGTISSSDLTITGGANSTFEDVTLEIAAGAVTSTEILDGTIGTTDLANDVVTADKIATAGNDQVLTTDGAGNPIWVDQSALPSNVTASNGLNVDATSSDVQLGGALTEPTEITTDATNTLAIAGLQPSTVTTDDVMVVDPTTGVVKTVNAVMPKFFYMPSIVFEVSATGTGLTRDLHGEYIDQFGTPQESSAGATTSIPTLGAAELEYHITYYDTNIFDNVSIDANGVLTYDVISTSVTGYSFMNIVFVVKN